METNPSTDTEILIDYSHGEPVGWRARITKGGEDIELLIEGASAIENVTKYVWRLTKNGKL